MTESPKHSAVAGTVEFLAHLIGSREGYPSRGYNLETASVTEPRPIESLPSYGFAALHKRAFGIATGTAAALVTFLMTAVYLIRNPRPGFDLGLLGQFFTGYSVSWLGALLGAAQAWVAGFVLGWFLAFTRNLVLAGLLFAGRSRAELEQTRDFLDHI